MTGPWQLLLASWLTVLFYPSGSQPLSTTTLRTLSTTTPRPAFNTSVRDQSEDSHLALHHGQQAATHSNNHSGTGPPFQSDLYAGAVQKLSSCDSSTFHITLSHLNLTELPPLGNVRCARQIRIMDLSYNQITILGADRLAHLSDCRLLNFSHNQLGSLQPGLLNSLQQLETLDLSHNQLGYLQPGLLNSLQQLKTLDLSHNRLSHLRPGSIPATLSTLNVSFNMLTVLENGLFHDLASLQYLDVSHNSISEVQPCAFHTSMDSVMWANFSYNNLTDFEPWPYVFNPLSVVDLSHNLISRFTNSMNLTVTRERLSEVSLMYNRLTHIRLDDFSIYLSNKTPAFMVFVFHFNLNIKHNPLVCDCRMYWVVEDLTDSVLALNEGAHNYFTCDTPPSLKGRNLGFLLDHAHLLVCDVTEGCPPHCHCQDTPHVGLLVISCDAKFYKYTRLPRHLPGDGLLSLNLSGHALSELTEGVSDVSRLKILDVSNNKVREVSPSFLTAASHLEVLYLTNNQLTSLPSHLKRLSIDNIHLLGNPLVCSCDLMWFGKWVQAVVTNASQETQQTTTRSTDTQHGPHNIQSAADAGEQSVAAGLLTVRVKKGQLHVSSSLQDNRRETVDSMTLTCKTSDGRKVAVVDTSQWGVDCHTRVTVRLLVAGGVLLTLLLVALALCWRCRYNIHVLWDYACGRVSCCRRQHTPASDDEQTTLLTSDTATAHNIYVSVDEEDTSTVLWVLEWLLPLLKTKGHNSLRAYFPLIDEEPGVCKADNRVDAISTSGNVLVVLTKGYASNGWCRFEFDQACHDLQHDNCRNLVIILNDIVQKRQSIELQVMDKYGTDSAVSASQIPGIRYPVVDTRSGTLRNTTVDGIPAIERNKVNDEARGDTVGPVLHQAHGDIIGPVLHQAHDDILGPVHQARGDIVGPVLHQAHGDILGPVHQAHDDTVGPVLHKARGDTVGPVHHQAHGDTVGPVLHQAHGDTVGPVLHEAHGDTVGSVHQAHGDTVGPVLHQAHSDTVGPVLHQAHGDTVGPVLHQAHSDTVGPVLHQARGDTFRNTMVDKTSNGTVRNTLTCEARDVGNRVTDGAHASTVRHTDTAEIHADTIHTATAEVDADTVRHTDTAEIHADTIHTATAEVDADTVRHTDTAEIHADTVHTATAEIHADTIHTATAEVDADTVRHTATAEVDADTVRHTATAEVHADPMRHTATDGVDDNTQRVTAVDVSHSDRVRETMTIEIHEDTARNTVTEETGSNRDRNLVPAGRRSDAQRTVVTDETRRDVEKGVWSDEAHKDTVYTVYNTVTDETQGDGERDTTVVEVGLYRDSERHAATSEVGCDVETNADRPHVDTMVTDRNVVGWRAPITHTSGGTVSDRGCPTARDGSGNDVTGSRGSGRGVTIADGGNSSKCRVSNTSSGRTRRLVEWSQYWEDNQGQTVVLEPLRSFLLEGRYLALSDRLFKYKLLFELRNERRS